MAGRHPDGISAADFDFPGARESGDPVKGSGHVQAVVDGLMDVGEGDAAEPRSFQDPRHGRRIGE